MCIVCGEPDVSHVATPVTDFDTTAMPPTVSLDQAIYQLTTQWVGSEGTTRTWATTTVYYAMPDSAPNYSSQEASGFRPMSPVMKDAARLSFELWDDLVAISLVESTSPTAQITFAYSSTTSGGGTYASSWISGAGPDYTLTRGRIWLNSSWSTHDQDTDMVFGGYGYITYIHEIGHALGLSHPGTYNGSATWSQAEYAQDTRQYTVMSYFDADENGSGVDHYGSDGKWKYASTPMLHDVAAIQDKYGADMTTRTGDTVYGFNFTADKSVFNFAVNKDPIICIWDAGGNDTLDASGYATNQRIDLRAGTYSDIGHMTQNVAIAYGAIIENAVGGSGADSILGNDVANNLKGGAGADTLTGGRGNDVFDGGTGHDLFKFATGDGADTINGFTAGGSEDRIEVSGYGSATLVQEGANLRIVFDAGNSILLTNVSASAFTAADLNVAFTLGGGTTPTPPPPTSTTINGTSAADTLNGTAAAETINGLGGNDVINGGDGADTIVGGLGADVINGGLGNDLFKFAAGDGADTINGFVAGGTDDRIEVTGFSSYTLVQEGANLRVVLDGSNSILLTNVSASAFTAADINIPKATTTPTPPPTGGIQGTSAADDLIGTGATDTIYGLGGNDTLTGYGGDDFLYGGDGIDSLRGLAGRDLLDGGAGNDTLTGGGSADTFQFTGLGFGADKVTDFTNGIDKIKFAGIAGVDSFSDLKVTSVSGAAVITLPDGSTVTLQGVSTSAIDASDFLYGP